MQNTLLVIIMMLFTFQQPETKSFESIIVLELFTSQGCSSCPKADVLLGSVKKDAKNNNIIALSYHVDYWNYIGWNDPFSSKYNTEKQRGYGKKFYSNRIYTPQLVINGKEHFVGSNAEILSNKLKTYGKQASKNTVSISNAKKNNNIFDFDYSINGDIKNKEIRFVLVIDERTTEVKKGENRNRTIKNENIVVTEVIAAINSKTGKATIAIPDVVDKTDNLRLVAIIQTKSLDITGATQLNL